MLTIASAPSGKAGSRSKRPTTCIVGEHLLVGSLLEQHLRIGSPGSTETNSAISVLEQDAAWGRRRARVSASSAVMSTKLSSSRAATARKPSGSTAATLTASSFRALRSREFSTP